MEREHRFRSCCSSTRLKLKELHEKGERRLGISVPIVNVEPVVPIMNRDGARLRPFGRALNVQ